MARNHHKPGDIGPEAYVEAIRSGRYFFDNFLMQPSCSIAGANAAPSGSTLVKNILFTGLNRIEFTQIVDQTDTVYPTLSETDGGYNVVLGTTVGMGVEYNFGGDNPNHPRNFTASSEDFFCRVLFSIADVSGADVLFGVKKAQAVTASLTEITDLYGVRILGDDGSALAAMSIVTNLNNAGTSDYSITALSTTLTDATSIELEIISRGGKAYTFINGAQVMNAPSYTFDSGDALSCFLRVSQTTDTCASVRLLAVEGGPMEASTGLGRPASTLRSRARVTA